MPLYRYQCRECGWSFDEIRRVADRDGEAACDRCEGMLARVFEPTGQFLIPTHFALKHVTAGWHLPRKENGRVDYSDLCRPGEIRKSPETGEGDLKKHLKQELLGREKITLSGATSG